MNPVDLHAGRLPLRPSAGNSPGQGSGLAQEPPPAGQGSRQAWLREMERAQMADWFQPSGMGGMRGNGPGPVTAAPALRVDPAETPARLPRGSSAPSMVSAPMRPVASAVALPERGASVASGSPSPSTAVPMAGGVATGAAAPLPQHAAGLAAAAYAAAGVDVVPAPMSGGAQGSAQRAGQASAQSAPLAASNPVALQAEVPRAFTVSAAPLPAPLPAPLRAAMAAVAVQDVSMPVLPDMAEPRTPGATARESANAPPRRSAQAGANGSHWQDAAQPLGMRLHAQWTDSGVHLWLGMDGSARQTGAQALAVVHSLQRLLRGQGQQLSRLVCNGRLVFDAAAPAPGAMRTPHAFSDIFDRLAASGRQSPPVSFFPSSKEIS